MKNILTVFAHPDDETLAMGATIHRLVKTGCRVSVAIPCTGVMSRRSTQNELLLSIDLENLRMDCVKALSVLGIKEEDIHLGDFPDNEIDKHSRLELIHWVERIIELVKPDTIFTHHRYCTNIDHQYCHEAVVIATRPSLESRIDLYCGEIPSSTGYLKPTQWEPNLYISASEENVNTKCVAMQTYKGEARPYPHPRSPEILKALAMVRGSESGNYFAEAFMVQKILI